MIRFYGAPNSSAGRTHWLLEELGIPYEYKRISWREGGTRTPEFLAINPTGMIPFLEDGDVKLFESMAINFYLAEKYGGALWPSQADDRARMYQWSLWSICNLLPPLLDIMYHGALLPEAERDTKLVEKGKRAVPSLLRVLEGGLAGKEFLVSTQFGVADVNAGSIVNLAPVLGCPLDEYPATARWLARLKARPAYQRAVSAA